MFDYIDSVAISKNTPDVNLSLSELRTMLLSNEIDFDIALKILTPHKKPNYTELMDVRSRLFYAQYDTYYELLYQQFEYGMLDSSLRNLQTFIKI